MKSSTPLSFVWEVVVVVVALHVGALCARCGSTVFALRDALRLYPSRRGYWLYKLSFPDQPAKEGGKRD